jgi:S-adenosylmethionine:tRNA-ribosyltransferase-isomerase (queuine synthetase)
MHVFDQGFQLEAILLAHEYLEQKLNALYKLANSATTSYIAHRKFKQLIDLLRSDGLLTDNYYYILNEFNRLRNVNSNQILNFSLGLLGAKKGDMI